MSVIDSLITNRTSGSTYKFTDLNRVETAFEYLQNKMNYEYGFNLRLFIKKEWTRRDLGQLGAQTLMNAYLQNVFDIRQAINTATQPPKSMRFLTAKEANDIEKVLQEVENTLAVIQLSWIGSGEIGSGEI